MNMIMEKPINIGNKLPDHIYKGEWVLREFYNKGYWHRDNIPNELIKKQWKPENGKYYLIWHHHTNPADPADYGEELLDYIEPVNFFIDYLKSHINQKIFQENISNDELLKVARLLKIGYK